MENYIHTYLSKFYTLSTSEESGKKIQLLVAYGIYYRDDVNKTKDLVYSEYLLKEITTVFGVPEDQAKYFISRWAITIDRNSNLAWYWKQVPLPDLPFPAAVRLAATTMASELVSVRPMGGPTGKLVYFDYVFSANTPNANGRIYTEEAMINARRDFIENQHQIIVGELNHPNISVGFSSRNEEIERQSWFNPKTEE